MNSFFTGTCAKLLHELHNIDIPTEDSAQLAEGEDLNEAHRVPEAEEEFGATMAETLNLSEHPADDVVFPGYVNGSMHNAWYKDFMPSGGEQ